MYLQPVRRQRRVRTPHHPFAVRHKPWVIQPNLIAPLLPGETLERILYQSRCVTDPINNPLGGWWHEQYFFIVRFNDLADRELLKQMLYQPDTDVSSLNSAADTVTYHYGSAINFTQLCLDRVRDEYFRMDGETEPTEIDGLPVASVGRMSALQSAMNSTDYIEDDPTLTVGADDAVSAREVLDLLREWQEARAGDQTDASYEEWLRMMGVRKAPPPEGPGRPELVRYLRSWSYPTNTIDPADGTPRSAVSWAIRERADKKRFTREPAFLFGVTVVRPKVFFKNQSGSIAALMNEMRLWAPRDLSLDPIEDSLKEVTAGSGPLASNTDGYIIDVRDLLLYGDQFVNFALTATDAGIVALPSAAMEKRYPSSTDVNNLFVDTTTPKVLVRQDGTCDLTIRTSVHDRTPPRNQ